MSQTTPAAEHKLNLGRLERIRRLLQYGAALVLLVSLVLIGLALFQLRALYRKIDAETERLKQLTEEVARKEQGLKALEGAYGVLSEVKSAYIEEHPEKADAVNDALRNAVETTIAQSSEQGGQPPEAAAQVPPRVYIHIMRASQRARAAEVARRLQAKGFLVPGIENREHKGNPQPNSDVRFYQGDAMADGDTADIRAVLDGFGVKLKTIALNRSSGVRPRHYELWFGDDFGGPAPDAGSRPDLPRPSASPDANRRNPNRGYTRRP
jgi:hypothetical protein